MAGLVFNFLGTWHVPQFFFTNQKTITIKKDHSNFDCDQFFAGYEMALSKRFSRLKIDRNI